MVTQKQGTLILAGGAVVALGAIAFFLTRPEENDIPTDEQNCLAQGGVWENDQCEIPPDNNGPPPQGCEVFPVNSPEWCECFLQEQGDNPRALGRLTVQTPAILSLIPKQPVQPINPSFNIVIKTFDACGRPKPNVVIFLSQSTMEWGGFVVPGTKNVNCGGTGIVQMKTDSNGELRARYLLNNNPGPGVVQTIIVDVQAAAEGFINQSTAFNINGTAGVFPIDLTMKTQEGEGFGGWRWFDCPA